MRICSLSVGASDRAFLVEPLQLVSISPIDVTAAAAATNCMLIYLNLLGILGHINWTECHLVWLFVLGVNGVVGVVVADVVGQPTDSQRLLLRRSLVTVN